MTNGGKCNACGGQKMKCEERHLICGPCGKLSGICQYPHNKPRELHGVQDEPPSLERDQHISEVKVWSNQSKVSEFASEEGTDFSAPLTEVTEMGCNAQGIARKCKRDRKRKLDRRPKGHQTGPSNDKVFIVRAPPFSQEDSLRARYLDLLEAKPTQWHPGFLWGNWLKLIALRLGRSPALDDATTCFVAGCFAHQNRTPENMKVAWKAYGHALGSIQRALADGDTGTAISTETIAATKFLTAFETLLDLGSYRWIPHYQGLGMLFVTRGCEANEDDLFRSLWYSILSHDLNEAISNGVDSVFDSPAWLHFASPEYEFEPPMFGVIQKVMMQMIVRIPRLIRLVRAIRRDTANHVVAGEALMLADKLYRTDLRGTMQGLLAQSIKSVPTRDSGLATYYPESIYYSTLCMMEALLRYSFCRIVIIGLCRQLLEHGVFVPMYGTLTLAEEEVECAGMIAMSLQHAEQHGDAIPMGPFVSMVPLQIAFGSWCRLERDLVEVTQEASTNGNEEIEKARFMMEWCRVQSNHIVKRWGGQQMSSDMLKAQVEVLEGAPLNNWKERRLFPL